MRLRFKFYFESFTFILQEDEDLDQAVKIWVQEDWALPRLAREARLSNPVWTAKAFQWLSLERAWAWGCSLAAPSQGAWRPFDPGTGQTSLEWKFSLLHAEISGESLQWYWHPGPTAGHSDPPSPGQVLKAWKYFLKCHTNSSVQLRSRTTVTLILMCS